MRGLTKIGTVCLSLVVVSVLQLSTAVGAPVDDLAKRLPDNAIVVVATSGGDALKGDFDKSSLGRIVNDPNLRPFVGSLWTQLQTKQVSPDLPDANGMKQVTAVLDYVRMFARRPMMVAVAQTVAKKDIPVWGFGVVDAGGLKPQISEAIAKFEASIGKNEIVEIERASVKVHGNKNKDKDEPPLYWGWVGNYFVVAVNDESGAAIQCVSKPRAAAPDFFQKVKGTDDALVVHYDFRKIGQLVGPMIAQESKGGIDPNMVTKALAGLGLDRVAGLTARMGFAGANLVSDQLIEVPEPRTGLLAACKPVDLSLLSMVDPNAVEASIVNCDPAAIYDAVMNTIKAVSPDDAYPVVQKGLAGVESELRISLRKDLLAAMGGPAVFYSMPAGKMVEIPMGGSVAIMKMKDAKLFEKTMVSLGKYIATQAAGSFQPSDVNDGSRTTHIWSIPTLAIAQIMPAWSVTGDTVVIASNTALHQMQVKYVASQTKRARSLLDTDGYKQVAAGLPKDLISFTYVDSQAQFSQMMTGLQQLWPIATIAIAQQGISLPPMLPNLDAAARQMRPGCRYAYFDAAGLHVHYQGSGIEESLGTVAGGAMAAGIAMPALVRTRDQARRVSSASNLKNIGLALIMSAQDNGGRFPKSLDDLTQYKVDSKILTSPRKPKDFGGPSYVYITGQTTSTPTLPRDILVYENPEFCDDGVNVLFGDGHVEFNKPEQFREHLAETCKRLGKPVPEVKFKSEDE
jgi:prepilin-type processing-associated H-X9-DG protein